MDFVGVRWDVVMPVRIESRAEPIPGYKLMERLGGGGFGEVWKCEAPGGLHKAIKFVYGDLQEVGEEGLRAEQELKALSRVKTVRHPYILSLERYDIIDGQLLIVMELADRNLWDRYKECRSQGLPGIPRGELLGYLEETAEALDLMNNQYQLQHLDIKPQNLFLVHQHVKVADFGLVKDLEGMQASVTGGVTPVYAAPETFDGWVSRFSDQYSLAIVYQELLTGVRPFPGNNVRQLVLQHLQGTPDLASLPPTDRPIIARALAKKPDERYPTCHDLVRDLRHSLAPRAEPAGSGTHADIGVEVDTAQADAPPQPADASGNGVAAPPPSEPTHWIHSQVKLAQRMQDSAVQAPDPEPPRRAPPEVRGDGVLFPALVIGIGRAGLGVLQQLREHLHDRLGGASAPHLRLLFLDTDQDALRAAARVPGPAALSAQETLLVPLNRPGHYLKGGKGRPPLDAWFNRKMLYRIPRNQVTLGVRALGRLAFCDNYRAVSRRLRVELKACLDPDALAAAGRHTGLGLRSNRPRVYVVTGLAGGTGSGMFLDLAYVVRQQLKQLGYDTPDVTGLLLVPPAPAAAPPGRPPKPGADDDVPRAAELGRRQMALGNAFAALTELRHFASPGQGFAFRYQEGEPTLRDADPPFGRTVLLPLPEEPDGVAGREMMALAAEYLYRDLCSPLGRTADLARADKPGPLWPERGLFYQTFGLYFLASPHRPVIQQAARNLCARVVQRWMSKDSKPLLPAVTAWVEEQWTEDDWTAAALSQPLEAAAGEVLGRAPQEEVEDVLAPLAAQVPREKGAKPREPDVELVKEAVGRLEAVFGWPAGEEVVGKTAVLPEALRDAGAAVVAERGEHLAQLIVSLIEQPEFRMAGAEEAVRQLIARIEAVLQGLEPRSRDLAAQAADAHRRMHSVIKALAKGGAGKGRPLVAAAGVLHVLRSYALARSEGLVQQQAIAILVSLRGQLSDQLREINYCRVRLTELLQEFQPEDTTPVRPLARPTMHALALAAGSGPDAGVGVSLSVVPGKRLYPSGCRTLDDAVERHLAAITAADLQELDCRVQGLVRQQFQALVHVCLTSANVLPHLEALMLQEAEAFIRPRLASTDVAELFLTQAGEDDAAVGELTSAFDEAAPEPGARMPSSPPLEMAVLLAPAGAAGDHLCGLARQALRDVKLTTAASADDIVVYRELAHLPLADLDLFGPAGQDAYRQMCAVEHLHPHTRTDIAFAGGA